MRKIHGLVFLFCTLAVLTAQAEEGRIPIFEPVVLSGSDIQGNYVLTRNIVLDAGATPVIQITGTHEIGSVLGESVYIDLNGFTLTNNSDSGAVIEATGLLKLVVHNGSLVALGGNGIKTSLVYEAVVEDLSINGNLAAPYIDGSAVLLDRPTLFGIRRVQITTPTQQSAIRVTSLDESWSWLGDIESNFIISTGGTNAHGIELDCAAGCYTGGGTIRDNGMGGPITGAGLKIGRGGNVQIANNVLGGMTHGIHIDSSPSEGSGYQIRGNHVGGGIHLKGVFHSRVTENIVAGGGLVLEATYSQKQHNSIMRNTINNAGPGIVFGPNTGANVYGGNTLLDNVGPCPNPTGAAACPEPEVCDETGGDAVSFGDNIAGDTGTAGPC